MTTGAHGMAGEFGHMPFGSRETLCRCGAHGCWNTELDGAALARALDSPTPVDEVSFSRAVLAAARAGERRRRWPPSAPARRRSAAAPPGWSTPPTPSSSSSPAWPPRCCWPRPTALQDAYRAGLMRTIAADPPPLVAGALGDRGPLVGAMEAAFAPVLAHPAV